MKWIILAGVITFGIVLVGCNRETDHTPDSRVAVRNAASSNPVVKSAISEKLIPTNTAPVTAEMHISREQAIALVKQEIFNRTRTIDIEVASAECKDDRWVLVVWALPKTPGGSAVFEVTTDSKVKTIGRGSR